MKNNVDPTILFITKGGVHKQNKFSTTTDEYSQNCSSLNQTFQVRDLYIEIILVKNIFPQTTHYASWIQNNRISI